MNTYPKIITQLLSLILFVTISINTAQAQEFKLSNHESELTVFGTSSLHDWHITTEQQSGNIKFVDVESGKIESLSLSVVAESLKSGKSSMDKNTYKALETDDY